MTPIPTTGTTEGWNVMASVNGIQVFCKWHQRLKDALGVMSVSALQFIYLFARLLGLPLIGGILFFQDWKLDPIFGFAFFLLGLAYISELVVERDAWRIQKNLSNPKARSI